MVLVEKSAAETEVSVALPPPIDPNMMFGGYQPQIIGPNTVKFKLNAPLTEAEAKISELIRAELGKLAA
jgi:hypothetical protein